jgi:hypothetical protein
MGRCCNIAVLAVLALGRLAAEPVRLDVDWPTFLGRNDLVWEWLPGRFDHGAFLGNGLLGATVYRDGESVLRFELGRTDVTEHRRDNARLPIGGLRLHTVGKIQDGTLRLDLWNAELRGEVRTDQGRIRLRALVHTSVPALLLDLESDEPERAAQLAWDARPCVDRRNARFGDPPNPPGRAETIEGLPVWVQPRHAGGEFATAWQAVPTRTGRRVILSIADTFPGQGAAAAAVATVRQTVAADFDALLAAHRAWWHAFYPRSFVSLPDPRVESFYWIQWYKLASASRPEHPPVDLLGPWYRDTGWPRIWWNLNIQTLYLPVYTGNRLELGESLTNFLDAKRANFARNAKEIWKFDDCATVPHTTDNQGLRGDGTCAPDGYINPGDFTWALHNYWLQYRCTMDERYITDQQRHALYPLLRGSINLYLRLLRPGDDGRLHLPVMHSPEYGHDADNNYNLALLRWGCQTLLDLNRRYRLHDPLAPRWQETLDKLTPYPLDEHGYRIGAKLGFTKSHRHWSHLLMVHPLHTLNGATAEERALIDKSVRHWLTVDGARGIFGWSRAAAASLYATLGDGENALKQIHGHLADRRFVMPNTQYIEGSPVIECSIVLNRSVQDMLLQSWGDRINVLPAIPAAWSDVVFHDLRAEGAFLVSAERRGGRTLWVHVRSLAGEPCRVQPNLSGPAQLLVNGQPKPLAPTPDGLYTLPLAKGDEAVLYTGDRCPPLVARPVPADPEACNAWGWRQRKPTITPSLASRKPATASSQWSPAYAPAKAVDEDPDSRWAGAGGTRSGWLEVDLGAEQPVARVVVMELQFPSTVEFTVSCQVAGAWREVGRGTRIDGVKTLTFPPVTTRRVRVDLLRTEGDVPTLGELQVFGPE